MRHAIFGGGNLGMDLRSEIARQTGTTPAMFSRFNGFDINDHKALMEVIERGHFSHIWYCVGAGSVDDAKRRPVETREIHVNSPAFLLGFAPSETRLTFFSSDYAADEDHPSDPMRRASSPRSTYAAMKLELERLVMESERPFTSVVRVGSLYGTAKPEQTFPGKIIERFGFSDAKVRLPQNLVTPTSTLWLAATLVQHLDALHLPAGPTLHHCAPRGNVSVMDWGIIVLNGLRDKFAFDRFHQRSIFFDPERPAMSGLGCSLMRASRVPHWFDVWRTYYRTRWFTPLALQARLPTGIDFEDTAGTPASSSTETRPDRSCDQATPRRGQAQGRDRTPPDCST